MSINLSRREQNILQHGKNGQRIQYRMKLRATIILQLAHENKTVHQVAENLGMTVKAVERSSFTPSI